MCVIQIGFYLHLTIGRSPSFNQHQFITGSLFRTQYYFREFNLSLQLPQSNLQGRHIRFRKCYQLLFVLFDSLLRCIIQRFKMCQRIGGKFCLLNVQIYFLTGFGDSHKEYFGRNTIYDHRIVFRLPFLLVVSFRTAIETDYIAGIFQLPDTCRIEVAPCLQYFLFFGIALQLLRQFAVFSLQSIYFIQYLQTTSSCPSFRCDHSIFLMLLILKQFQSSCQAVGKTDILLQFRIVGSTLLFLHDVDYTKFAQAVQEFFVFLMINQECEFLHFCNHASSSFLFS